VVVGAAVFAGVGWGLGGRHAITPSRVGGALVCVAAVAVAVHDRLGGHGALALVVLPVVAGIAVAIQSALNGRVGAAAGSPCPVTLVNFVVAALTLAVALLVELTVRGVPSGKLTGVPWLCAAGLIGIGVVAIATLAVRHVVLIFGLASVAGQLLGALALDVVTPGPRPPP
jgi:transporter family-2 protein